MSLTKKGEPHFNVGVDYQRPGSYASSGVALEKFKELARQMVIDDKELRDQLFGQKDPLVAQGRCNVIKAERGLMGQVTLRIEMVCEQSDVRGHVRAEDLTVHSASVTCADQEETRRLRDEVSRLKEQLAAERRANKPAKLTEIEESRDTWRKMALDLQEKLRRQECALYADGTVKRDGREATAVFTVPNVPSDVATGTALRAWASMLGLTVFSSETDAQVRDRILRRMEGPQPVAYASTADLDAAGFKLEWLDEPQTVEEGDEEVLSSVQGDDFAVESDK